MQKSTPLVKGLAPMEDRLTYMQGVWQEVVGRNCYKLFEGYHGVRC